MNETELTPTRKDDKKTTIPRFIAVEGAIGAGKTTLAKRLAASFNYDTLLERADENPFLERFYQDRSSHALSTQLFFLLQRAEQIKTLTPSEATPITRIADFLIEKDPLFAEATLDKDELSIYQQVYQQLTINTPKPDLVIYLQAPVNTLLQRIKGRSIKNEQSIDSEYLETLHDAYTRFFHFYEQSPLLIVNTHEIDWVNNNESYEQLVDYILSIKQGRHYFNPTSTLL